MIYYLTKAQGEDGPHVRPRDLEPPSGINRGQYLRRVV